jgi:hypothetical protein
MVRPRSAASSAPRASPPASRASVGDPADPRRPVHAPTDVALVSDGGLPGVQAHSHAHLTVPGPFVSRQGALGCNSRCQRPFGAGKCKEERVALIVDLSTLVRVRRLPEDARVLGENAAVPLSELLEQPRRALDVCEEESDGPLRELSHPQGLTPTLPSCQARPNPNSAELSSVAHCIAKRWAAGRHKASSRSAARAWPHLMPLPTEPAIGQKSGKSTSARAAGRRHQRRRFQRLW